MEILTDSTSSLALDMILKGYTPKIIQEDLTHIDSAYKERVVFFSYNWQCDIEISEGRAFVKNRGAGGYYIDPDDIPEQMNSLFTDKVNPETGAVERAY